MTREWKVGDEVACIDGRCTVSIHRIEAITPAGFLKIGDGVLLNPFTLRCRGEGVWSRLVYREVTDEIRKTANRQKLVRRLQMAPWENLPTATLEAVHEALMRCKADARAAAK